MKIKCALLIITTVSLILHSCGNKGDNFVGNWIVCNEPQYTCIIAKNGNTYNFHANNGMPDLILEKKGEDVLSAVAGGFTGTVRYDKLTNHLLLIEVQNKEERRIELCKSSDNTKQQTKQESQSNGLKEDAQLKNSQLEPSRSSIGYQNIISFYKSTIQELTQYFMKVGWTVKNDLAYNLNTYSKNGKFFFGNNFNYKSNEYDLWDISYDMNGWTNNNNERIELLQKSGHDNIIIYYTSKKNFGEIQNITNENFKLFNTIENTNESKEEVYRNGNDELRFKYKAWDSYDKDQKRTRKEVYQITLLNWNDLDIIKQELCSNCHGKGETRPEGQNEYNVCAVCNGTGYSNK